MAWHGKSLSEVCAQIKDPQRNGGKSLREIVRRMAEDGLVGRAWHPGPNLTPPPGSQERLGGLFEAWADSGAVCPWEGRPTKRLEKVFVTFLRQLSCPLAGLPFPSLLLP